MTNEQIVEIYAANKEAIDAVWVELGDDATLKDATLEWMTRTKRQSGCNWLMGLIHKGACAMRNFFVLMVLGAGMLACDTASAQIFGRRDVNVNANGVRVNVDRRAFGRDRVFVNGVRVDNARRNRGRDVNVNVVNAVPFAAVKVSPFAVVHPRFNAFGTFTQQDAFGNVFEVNSFGNSRFVGNQFNRGFQGTVFRSSAFHGVGVVPFATCH